MSVTLEKVTNIGIKLTDGHVVPAIRAVLSGVETSAGLTDEEVYNLMYEVYTNSTGAVAGVSYWCYDDILSADVTNLPDMDVTYGDDTGFKLNLKVENHETTTTKSQWIRTGSLYYKGDAISSSYAFTGYSAYELGYLVIFTDEDYNLITGWGSSSTFENLFDTAPGIAVSNGIPVAAVIPDATFTCRETSKTLYSTATNIKDELTGEMDPGANTDPYNPEGESTGPGGGNGDRSLDSDNIDIPSLPTLSAVDTGFIRLFNPNINQLQALSSYMWSNAFDLDFYKKIFADPMDCILGLSIVPVAVPDGGLGTVTVGNISTGVSMNKAASQYVEVNCGSINVNEYWGAYLDYEPFTKAEIYLPYVGTHPVSIDDIMGRTITIKYHVDILSGACTAYIKCGNSVLYQFIGQCASSIPITGSDWTNVINGALSIATAIGSMVATGGASAPAAANTVVSTAVNSMKPSIEKSGSMSGTGGMLAIQKPYLILTRPKQAVPARQNHYMGYPSFITSNLGFLSGFTVMEEIHLEGLRATDEELQEIEALLKEGVIL